MKKLISIVILLTAFFSVSAFAIKIIKLYHEDIPVTSQSDDERAQAARVGFVQLLIKLTGDPAIEKNPDIKDAIKRADYYVSEFSYSSPTTNSATYFIHLTFEANDVNRLLHRAGVSFWGEKRPLILVWLTLTSPHHPIEIIGDETPGELLESMKFTGEKLGLPLIFPLMDVTDIGQISPEDVSTMDLTTLKKAGKRYAPNAYLIGNIEALEDGYQTEWQLVLGNRQWKWTIATKSLDDAITKVLSQTSQTLSTKYDAKF